MLLTRLSSGHLRGGGGGLENKGKRNLGGRARVVLARTSPTVAGSGDWFQGFYRHCDFKAVFHGVHCSNCILMRFGDFSLFRMAAC